MNFMFNHDMSLTYIDLNDQDKRKWELIIASQNIPIEDTEAEESPITRDEHSLPNSHINEDIDNIQDHDSVRGKAVARDLYSEI